MPLELLHMVEEKKKETNYATTSIDSLFERLLVIFVKIGSEISRINRISGYTQSITKLFESAKLFLTSSKLLTHAEFCPLSHHLWAK